MTFPRDQFELSCMNGGTRDSQIVSRSPLYSSPPPQYAQCQPHQQNHQHQHQQQQQQQTINQLQQANLKQKFFYRKIIAAIIFLILLMIIVRGFYHAMGCDRPLNPLHVFNSLENRRWIIEDHAQRRVLPSSSGWAWCSNSRANSHLLAQPLQLVDQWASAKNLTDEHVTNIMDKATRQSINEDQLISCTGKSRLSRLRDVCQQYQLKDRILSPWHLNPKTKCDGDLRSCPLMIDDRNGLVACLVPKLFEPNTMNELLSLDSNKTGRKPRPLISPITLMEQNDQLLLVNNNNNHTKKLMLMFTRHPFSRLVQAFRKRFELPQFTADGKPLVFDNQTMHMWTFEEWCEELLLPTSPYQYDPSWAPVWTQCEPCFLHYDYIGKFETMHEDFQNIRCLLDELANGFNIRQLSDDCHPESYQQVADYMRKLKPQTIVALYKKFFLDFELFGYTIEEIFV